MGDDLQYAVKNADVCLRTKKFLESRRDKLIETMADALALHLLEAFELRRVTVELRKYILPEVQSSLIARRASPTRRVSRSAASPDRRTNRAAKDPNLLATDLAPVERPPDKHYSPAF